MPRYPTFDDVWERIKTLEGAPIRLAEGGEMEVITVDETGIVRRSSRGHISRMSIESFRWTVDELKRRGQIDRIEILEGIGRRESSGVVAVLAATGLYQITSGARVGLRLMPPT